MRLVTYNLRFATAPDGPDSWPFRRELALERLREAGAVFFGLQEALQSQIDEVLTAFPGMDYVGVGRDDGNQAGEQCPIFFPRSQPPIEWGTRWISESPLEVGSRGPGANLPRVFTWARFESFVLVNTHLDHESEAARALGATQMAEFLEREARAVVIGDFNATAREAPVRILEAAGFHRLPTEGATFNGFDPTVQQGDAIDHVLVRGFEGSAQIDFSAPGGRCPSDHWPIAASLRVQS